MKLLDWGSQAWDQVNPFDNGRTAKQRTPVKKKQGSIIHQATHNGATNTVGNMVLKPVLDTAQAVAEAPRLIVAAATENDKALEASRAREWENLKGSIPGFFAQQGKDAALGTANLAFKAPILDLMNKTAEAEAARVQGLREFNRTLPGMAVRPIEHGIANLTDKNLTDEVAKQRLAEVGIDPNATGAQKWFADPVLGVVGTLGLAKGAQNMALRAGNKGRLAVPKVEQPKAEIPPPPPPSMHSSELDLLNKINADSKKRILTLEEQTVRATLQAKKDAITKPVVPEIPTPGQPVNNLGDALNMERFKNPNAVEPPKITPEAKRVQDVNSLSNEEFSSQLQKDLGISKNKADQLVKNNNKPALHTNLYGSKEKIKTADSPDAYATTVMNQANKRGKAALDQGAPAKPAKTPEPMTEWPDQLNGVKPEEVAPVTLSEPKTVTPPTTPVKTEAPTSFIEQYKTTDPKKLTPEETILTKDQLREKWNTAVDHIEARVKSTGKTMEDFNKVIQEADRNGAPIPDWAKAVKAEYDQGMKGLREILPEGTGNIEHYSPQSRPIKGEPTKPSGSTLIDEIDGQFNFGKKRKDAIPLNELDYSTTPLRRLGDQLIETKFKQPEMVALAKDLTQAAKDGGLFQSGIQKLDVVDRISKLGDVKKVVKETIDAPVSWTKRQFSTSTELYDGVKMADGRRMSDAMGFTRYIDSEAIAQTLITQMEKTGDVNKVLTDRFKDAPVDKSIIDKVIANTERKIEQIDEKKLTPEEVQMSLHHAVTQAERTIAREQLTNFLESTTITDKQLLKSVNYDAKRMLMQDAANQALAERLVNGITGTFYTGALGYNPLSAFQNITENKRTYSLFTPKEAANATGKAVVDGDITTRYGVHETKVGDVLEQRGKAKAPRFWKPMGMFQKAEAFKDATLLHALEAKYIKEGKTGTDLTTAVLTDFRKYAIKYGQSGSLGFNKSKTGRLVGQFMQFTIKDFKITGEKVAESLGKRGSTKAEKVAAQKYLAKLGAQNVALYLTLNAMYGASWEYVFGVMNPVQGYDQKKARWDEKVVRRIPGGPAVDLSKDLYLAISQEVRNAKEDDRAPELKKVLNNSLKKDAALLVPGGNQIFNKTGGFLADQYRGYNESATGRARFAASTDKPNIVKGLVLGKYSTDNAREYFGNQKLAGDLPGRGSRQQWPISQRYQDLIKKDMSNKDEIPSIINKARENTNRYRDFNATPQGKAWSELNSSTYNPVTKKHETDVITPEKWKGIQADKSGKTFKQIQEAAKQRHRDFGDPLDPIFDDKWKANRTEIMTMRAQFTGDDTEMKDIARQTTKWYQPFQDEYIKYIQESLKRDFKASEDYGPNQRVQDYYKLTAENPSIPDNQKKAYPLIDEYYAVKKADPEAGKQFFKDHLDTIKPMFEKQAKEKWEWTNKMRAIEGAKPIDWATFQNVTFGYEDDERKVAQDLYWKLKGDGSGYGKGGGSSSGDFSFPDAKNPKIAKPNIKVKKLETPNFKAKTKKLTVKSIPRGYTSRKLG